MRCTLSFRHANDLMGLKDHLRRPILKRFSQILLQRFLKHDFRTLSLYLSSLLRMYTKPPLWVIRLCSTVFRVNDGQNLRMSRFMRKAIESKDVHKLMIRYDFVMHMISQGRVQDAFEFLSSFIGTKRYCSSPLFQGLMALLEISLAFRSEQPYAASTQYVNAASKRLQHILKSEHYSEIYVSRYIQICIKDSQNYKRCLKILSRYCRKEPLNPNTYKLMMIYLLNFGKDDKERIVKTLLKAQELDPVCPFVRQATLECYSKYWISAVTFCNYLSNYADYYPDNAQNWQLLCNTIQACIVSKDIRPTDIHQHQHQPNPCLTSIPHQQETLQEDDRMSHQGSDLTDDDYELTTVGQSQHHRKRKSEKPSTPNFGEVDSLMDESKPKSLRESRGSVFNTSVRSGLDRSVYDSDSDGNGPDDDDDRDSWSDLESEEVESFDGNIEDNLKSVSNKDFSYSATVGTISSVSDGTKICAPAMQDLVWMREYWIQHHFGVSYLSKYLPGGSCNIQNPKNQTHRVCLVYKSMFASFVYGSDFPFVRRVHEILSTPSAHNSFS